MSVFSLPIEYIISLRPSMFRLFKYDPMTYLYYYASVTQDEDCYDLEFLTSEDFHNFCRDILGEENFLFLELSDNLLTELKKLEVRFTIIADTELNPLVIFPTEDDFVKAKLALGGFTEMTW